MGPGTQSAQMFLATMQPAPKQKLLACVVILLSFLFFVAAVPFARIPLTPVWGFIPVYESALALNDLITATLLFAKFSILRWRALLVLACGYLFATLMVIPHALTFPGLFSTGGLLGAAPQTTVWLYIFWHASFPCFVIAYSAFRTSDGDAVPPQISKLTVISSVAATCAACILITLLTTAGHDFLPELIRNRVYTPAMISIAGFTWALSPISLAVLWRRRPHSVIDLCLMVVMCAWTFDVGLSAVFNAARFDLGFYAGRIFGLIASTTVLLVLLVGTAGLYAKIVGLLQVEERALERTSEALRNTVARFQAIFSSAAISMLMLNESGSIESINPATESLFGKTSTEMLGHDVRRFVEIGGSDDINSAARLRDLLASGSSFRPLIARHGDGSTFPVDAVLAEMIVSNKNMFVLFVHDGRGKKLAEEKFRLAVEACPSGIVMIDASGKIILANAAVERLFGYGHDDLHNLSMRELVAQPFETPQHFDKERELHGRRKSGEEFPIEVDFNPIHTGEGQATLCVIVDVSERKHNERMKNEFVATVSHELRTPLTSIAASLGLLQASTFGKDSPETPRRLLNIALSNSQRLVRLINDILDIERIESGKTVFNLSQVHVRYLVEQAIEYNRGLYDQSGLTVQLDPESIEIAVYADTDRLMQVITNLLSNAVKFSHRDGVVIVAVSAVGDNARISVRDHGPGIPEKFRPHVFEKFAQADATDARKKGGTGLGLSIARQIMLRFNGDLKFEDAPGGGTVFHADLPRFVRDDVVAPNTTILLCDDDRDAGAFLADQLRLAGFATDIASSAEQAVHNAAQRRYAAVLVDLQRPDADCVGLIKQLRLQWHYVNTPIIVFTADPDHGQLDERSSALNILDWLSKPVDIERLTRVLSRPIIRDANPRPRMLHVDNDSNILQIVSIALSQSVDIVSAVSAEHALRELAKSTFDLALIDIDDSVGVDLLPQLRDSSGYPVPVIVLSGHNTSEISAQMHSALTKNPTSIDGLASILRQIVVDRRLRRTEPIKEVA